MTIDLQLVEHFARKHGKSKIPGPGKTKIQLSGPRLESYMQSRNGLDLITKQLRDSTWRRHESHNKQLQHFLDRDRYQMNATWQSEYDRLASQTAVPGQWLFVHDRMQQLKDLLVR